MKQQLPKCLLEIVGALPLQKGICVLEIGCGTGTAAREIVDRIGDGFILGLDRSINMAVLEVDNPEQASLIQDNDPAVLSGVCTAVLLPVEAGMIRPK